MQKLIRMGDKRKMTIEMYEDVMNHLQIDKYRELIIKQDQKITELEKACDETQELLDKQIEATYKLDKENAELKEKLKTAYRKGMRHMAKALKDYDRTDGAWTDYFEHTVDKVLQREQLDFEEYGTLADQLTKAKRIIQEFLDLNYSEFTKTNAVFLHADKFLKESK